jgi:hypothetical protein
MERDGRGWGTRALQDEANREGLQRYGGSAGPFGYRPMESYPIGHPGTNNFIFQSTTLHSERVWQLVHGKGHNN